MVVDDNGIINLSNQIAECKISLFGGQIISYRPKNEEYDVFWMGNLNKFDNISAIRGGVPICWPRFAAEKLNDNFPRHGFARIVAWKLQKSSVKDDKIEVELSLEPEAKYNTRIVAKLFIKITDKLECSLETTNLSEEDFKFSEALHAYFNVGSRDEAVIRGLSGYDYQSSLDGKIYRLEKDLVINDEFDAAFMNHSQTVEIVDKVYKRIITMNKIGSTKTVVWNPNKDLAEMSLGQYRNFICVEPANQGENFVTLKPQQKHKITMIVNVKKII